MSVKISSYLLSLALAFACFSLGTGEGKFEKFFDEVGDNALNVVEDVKHPIEALVVNTASSQCSNVRKLLGWDYEQLNDENEPDVLNELTINFISQNLTVIYNISTAAQEIPKAKGFDNTQKLFIFVHGYTDDPANAGKAFVTIRDALFEQGIYNVLALDGSSLVKWLYLRSTTYIRFMGEKLGEVCASMVNAGMDPSQIHIIGHSLGSHVSSFAGKTFANLTGQKVGRMTGLDPAGPCFTHVGDDVRLNATDAQFVDVIHTDGGVFGLSDPVGHVDFFPNGGIQQPNCLAEKCNHRRSWRYFAESIKNNTAFPAVKCKDWDAFKKGECDAEVSYMGFTTKPETNGLYFLRTGEDSPYGLGTEGTKYSQEHIKLDTFVRF